MANENKKYEIGEFRFYNLTKKEEITEYVTSCTWQGGLGEAARSIDFAIIYTTAAKDKDFKNKIINLGERIQIKYKDKTETEYIIFEGNVFLRNRNSEGYIMEFKAYDNLIYLAKSEMQAKFNNQNAVDIIKQVCSTLGVMSGTIHEDLNIKCDFISDGMTGTEIIKKCLDICASYYGYRYKAVMVDNGKGQQVLNVVRAYKDDVVEEFKISDEINLISAQYSESIEEMVNQVQIVNDNGEVTGYIKLNTEITQYGLLQKVYKYDSKQNTEQAAKLLLRKTVDQNTLSSIGNVKCISGFVISVEAENVKGEFMIVNDKHTIENNQHRMELTIDYLVEPDSRVGATTEGNVNPPPTQTKKGGKGNKNTKVGLRDGINAFKGQTYSPDPANGCVWAATGISSYYSEFAAQEYNNGVVYVPTLVSDAQASGLYQRVGEGTIEAGDILVYGDMQHVVVATGGNGYAGNSSSRGKVIEDKDFTNMSGMYVTGIIKTSRA